MAAYKLKGACLHMRRWFALSLVFVTAPALLVLLIADSLNLWPGELALLVFIWVGVDSRVHNVDR